MTRDLVPANRSSVAVFVGAALIGAAAGLVLWTSVLPAVLQTGAMATGLAMVVTGFAATCLSFYGLLVEGRGSPRAVPVLAVRLALSIGFTGWVSSFLLTGATLTPSFSNIVFLIGTVGLALAFLGTVVLGGQVDQVAEAEEKKSENLSRIRAKASRLQSETELSGTHNNKAKMAQVLEELRFLSPSLHQEAWDTEMQILQTLTDLAGETGASQDQRLDKLLVLIRNRRKIHD